MVNYYKVLQLPDDPTFRDIQLKYQHLLNHKVSSVDGSRIDHELVRTAYEVLGSSTQRHEYNKQLGLPAPRSTELEEAGAGGHMSLIDRQKEEDDDIEKQIIDAQQALFEATPEKTSSRP
ncbi:MAG: hypothetical protein Q9168_003410 [Polycauliona sp. 1 TL-2023]